MSVAQCLKELETHGLAHRGTHLGGLLQWAKLHIDDLTEALSEREAEAVQTLAENRHMRTELQALCQLLGQAQSQAQAVIPPDPFATVSRDITSHINLMMASGAAGYVKTKRKTKAPT